MIHSINLDPLLDLVAAVIVGTIRLGIVPGPRALRSDQAITQAGRHIYAVGSKRLS